MNQIAQYFRRTLSARISLWVLLSVTILFVVALVVMFRFSHNAIERESLDKAQQMLDGKALCIDNQLHKVEVATSNMLWNVEQHLDEPDSMFIYSTQMVTSNPDIVACAIAFEPDYYKEKGRHYITYAYRMNESSDDVLVTHDPTIIQPDVFCTIPYTEVNWYFVPKQANAPHWVRPHTQNDTINSTIISYCMPIHDKQGKFVGILAADVLVERLSHIILDTKPFPNSYCTMFGSYGSYIIHPDNTKIYHKMLRDVAKEEPDKRVEELVESMLAGESGCRFVQLSGKDSYVLYKPLNRRNWSVCIVCPESDIFSMNRKLLLYMVVITIVGILLICSFCFYFVNRQLNPLNMLAMSSQRIAKGNFSTSIPSTVRVDEIGILQNNFGAMQTSLSRHIEQISQLSGTLKERNEELKAIHTQVKDADNMKMKLIHKIADKMILPIKEIEGVVSNLDERRENIQNEDIQAMSGEMMNHTKTITDLLDQMLDIPKKKKKKTS